jgi:hypothetical protein
MKQYPSYSCPKHPRVSLVDVVDAAGAIEPVCPRCVPVELIDVVRQLHRRTGGPTA